MGNSKSLPFDQFINGAPHIHLHDDLTVVRKLHHSSVVSYVMTFKVHENQPLKCDHYVDAVGKFKCSAKIDILIDGEIHYQNVEDFTLVLVAMDRSKITIRTHTDEPVIISCTGYSFDYSTRMLVAGGKIKTNTTKYSLGHAREIVK